MKMSRYYHDNTPVVLTVLATLVLVSSVIYALALMQRTFHGANTHDWKLADASPRELATFGSMIAITIWLGLYPQPVFDLATPALGALRAVAAIPTSAK